MTRLERMKQRLTAEFTPDFLDILDESARHAGHAGARPGGETHYQITMTSTAFTGRSRVERHRLVNAALGAEFSAGLHALALNLKAPGE